MPTKTLQPIQISLTGGRWADFSDDDEYNMKAQGVTDPNDLTNHRRQNPDGTIIEYSQNQRNAEIKASANLDKLKKIYSTEVSTFADNKENAQYFKDKEDDRQLQLNQDYLDIGKPPLKSDFIQTQSDTNHA